MSIQLLSKRFKLGFCVFFLFLSCTKKNQDNTVVIKIGKNIWTFKEVQNYFQFRLNTSALEEQKPEQLKKEILNEIYLRSLVENWAKQNKIQSEKVLLTEEEKKTLPKNSPLKKALKDHKSYLSLYNLLLKDFSKKTPDSPLKEQRIFYNKNKTRFMEPLSCRLKQILVNQEKLAQTLYQRLKQGESFDKLNKLYSLKKNPGWVKKGELDIFDRACFQQKDSLSLVLKSPYGYHIFLMEEKKPSRQKHFKSVQKQIIQVLKKHKAKEQFQVWLKQEIFKTPLWTNQDLLDKIHIQHKTNDI